MKKQDHTGFRNGDLFCFNCGESYKMNLPQPARMAVVIMKEFARSHKSCPKTWIEPTPPTDNRNEIQKAHWWLANGEQGMSSKTMWGIMMGVKPKESTHPYDPDDFKRCYLLLKAVPEWKSKLDLMRSVDPVWDKLIDNWDKLTEMYEENMRTEWKNHKKIGMYEFMKSLGC